MNNWHEEQKQRAMFVHFINTTINGVNGAKDVPDTHPDVLMWYWKFREYIELKDLQTYEQAETKFLSWYKGRTWFWGSAGQSQTLEFKREYRLENGGSVTFGLAANFVATSEQWLRIYYENMAVEVESNYNIWRNTQYKIGSDVSYSTGGARDNIEEVSITRLTVGFDKGRKKISAIGGRYEKHGIPVYPEFLEKLGLDVKTLAMGDIVFEPPKIAVVKLKANGNPEKVIDWL